MATICIQFPDSTPIKACIEFPDGDEEINIGLARCAHCHHYFVPKKETDRFDTPQCQIDFNSRKRPRKTKRRRAS